MSISSTGLSAGWLKCVCIARTDFNYNYHQWAPLLALTAPSSSHPECPEKNEQSKVTLAYKHEQRKPSEERQSSLVAPSSSGFHLQLPVDSHMTLGEDANEQFPLAFGLSWVEDLPTGQLLYPCEIRPKDSLSDSKM